jgi:hypothetical protein
VSPVLPAPAASSHRDGQARYLELPHSTEEETEVPSGELVS